MVGKGQMEDQEILIPCSACGRPQRRSEMFGAAPDLLCQQCRDGVSQRLNVRFRPLERERKPTVTLLCLGIAGILYVLTDQIYGAASERRFPAWLAALYQGAPIWTGEVWRHLTCIFLHGGFFHLLMNGMGIWFLGRQIESGWGHGVMAGLIVLTGVSAAAVSWIMTTPGSVGISGALFGLVGYLWALRRVHPRAAMVMNDRMIRSVLTMLVIGVILTQSGRYPIDNWAHGVGLGMGFLVGLAVRHPQRRRLVPLCGLLGVVLVVASMFLAFGEGIPMREISRSGESRDFTATRAEYRKWWIQEHRRP